MPQIQFLPQGQTFEVDANTKVLVAAIRNKVPIRYGCAACQCGTCGIAIANVGTTEGELAPMADDERALLSRMGLKTDGTVRLACRARIVRGRVVVDLGFQSQYSPEDAEGWRAR